MVSSDKWLVLKDLSLIKRHIIIYIYIYKKKTNSLVKKIYLLKTWTWLGEEVIIQAVLISAKMNQQGTASTNLKTNDREKLL